MTDDATIPAKCPQCGSTRLRVEVVTWAIYRDGELDGFLIGDTEVVSDGAVVCDNDSCTWALR